MSSELSHRAILPKYISSDVEWTKLLQLCPDDLRQLSCRDFLNRLQLTVDIDRACRAKVKRFHTDKSAPSNLNEQVTKEKMKFAIEARAFIVSMLESLLDDVHFTADIIHGMGCFDPHVLLLCLLSKLHSASRPNTIVCVFVARWTEIPKVIIGMSTLNSLITSEALTLPSRMHPKPLPICLTSSRLCLLSEAIPGFFYLFRLCCLCITEAHQELPAVKFRDDDPSSCGCQLSAVILPAQSYSFNCTGDSAACKTESASTKYRELEGQFSSWQLVGDPWTHVVIFGRAQFSKTLTNTFENLKEMPVIGVITASRSSSASATAVRKKIGPLASFRG